MTKENTYILIDGSGSMAHPQYNSCLTTCLNVVRDQYKGNKAVTTLLWGNKTPQKVRLSGKKAFEQALKGLNCGSDLSPVLDMITNEIDAKEATHVVILSDGDIFDRAETEKAIENLRAINNYVKLDMIVMSERPNTNMQNFCDTLDIDCHHIEHNAEKLKATLDYVQGNEIQKDMQDLLKELSSLKQDFTDKAEKIEKTLKSMIKAQMKTPKP